MSILETRAYEINDEEKNTRYKELARLGGPVAHENFYTGEGKIENHKGTISQC